MKAPGMPERTEQRGRLDAAKSSSIHWWPLDDRDIYRRQSYTHGLGAVESIHRLCARGAAELARRRAAAALRVCIRLGCADKPDTCSG
jgi:hypothetical protein